MSFTPLVKIHSVLTAKSILYVVVLAFELDTNEVISAVVNI